MAGKAELGKTFLQELGSKLPDSLRGNLDAILSSPEAQAALEAAGSRVSPLDEERQRLNSLKTQLDTRDEKLNAWHANLGNWARDREADFTERERKLSERENGGAPPGDRKDPPPANGSAMTKDDVTKLVVDTILPREGAYVQYVADATNFSAFHLKNFNEALDVAAIVQHPDIGKIGFRGVYELLHKTQLDDMRAKADKAKEDAIRADERAKVLGETPVDMPYPIGEGSPLDALNLAADKRPTGDPAAAARMYEELVRTGAGAR